MPKIDIIIPCASAGLYFESTVRSVLAQTHTDFRIVACDEASPHDNYINAVKKLDDRRIEYVRFTDKRTMSGNWQRCVDLVETDFFCLLHDDDVWEPNYLESSLELLRNNPRASHAVAMHLPFEGEIKTDLAPFTDKLRFWTTAAEADPNARRLFLTIFPIGHMSSTLFRRNAILFDMLRGWNADQQYIFDCGALGEVLVNLNTRVHIRMHPWSLTSGFNRSRAARETLTLFRDSMLTLIQSGVSVGNILHRNWEKIDHSVLFRVLQALYSWPLAPELVAIGDELLADPKVRRSVAGYSGRARLLTSLPRTAWILASLAMDLSYYRGLARRELVLAAKTQPNPAAGTGPQVASSPA